MKNDLKISVIIPAYNAEKYLTATLDSVVSQTMSDSDYEIIIVNDGSSDHTADILEKYKNNFLHPKLLLEDPPLLKIFQDLKS